MKRRELKHESRTGFWSTVGTAVQSGWGPTVRLICIILAAGILLLASVAGGEALMSALRASIPWL